MKRILIYDDNSQHSKDLAELLKKLLSVKTVIDIANNSDKAMELITANSYAVIFLDIELIQSPVSIPVNIPHIISGYILSVARKLCGSSLDVRPSTAFIL